MRIRKRDGFISCLLDWVTCGLYSLYFWYCVGTDANDICQKDGKYTGNYIVAWLLNIVTCGIYGVYWRYQLGQRLEDAGNEYGVRVESAVWFTVITYLPVLSYLYVCSLLNRFSEKYEEEYNKGNVSGGGPNRVDFAEELKTTVQDVGKSIKKSVPTCANCGTVINPGRNYCAKCGYPIKGNENHTQKESAVPELIVKEEKKNICPVCGKENIENGKFCTHCGNQLAE